MFAAVVLTPVLKPIEGGTADAPHMAVPRTSPVEGTETPATGSGARASQGRAEELDFTEPQRAITVKLHTLHSTIPFEHDLVVLGRRYRWWYVLLLP